MRWDIELDADARRRVGTGQERERILLRRSNYAMLRTCAPRDVMIRVLRGSVQSIRLYDDRHDLQKHVAANALRFGRPTRITERGEYIWEDHARRFVVCEQAAVILLTLRRHSAQRRNKLRGCVPR